MSTHPRPDPHPRHDPLDEYTLLCEACGYVLEGLDHAGICPECATPIRASLPHLTRPGSPWQQDPTFRSFVATCREMLLRPQETLSRVRIDARSSGSFEGWITFLNAGLIVTPGAVYYTLRILTGPNPSARTSMQDLALGLLVVGVAFTMSALALSILTGIERTGIRTFGRIHRRRISFAVATTICAHAGIGWLTGSLLFMVTILIGITTGPRLLVLFAPLGLCLGLLHFEILVWLGVRRCRYANRERPDARPPAPTAPAS